MTGTPFVEIKEFEALVQRFEGFETTLNENTKMLTRISQALDPAYGQKSLFVRVESIEQDQSLHSQKLLNIESKLNEIPTMRGKIEFLMKWFWTASGAGAILVIVFETVRWFLK